MAKPKLIKLDFKRAELVANWIIRFQDEENGQKKLAEADRLCVLNGMEPGELQKILDGEFVNYDYTRLLEINKIISGKRRK